MRGRTKELYEALDEDPPDRLRAKMGFWTYIRATSFSGGIECINTAKNDGRQIVIRGGSIPDEIAGMPVFTESGGLNPDIKRIPVKVIIPKEGFREAWIYDWVEDVSELRQDQFPHSKREETIEWDGTSQNRNGDRVEKRTEVFSEADNRGSKNDLIK